MKNKLLLLVFVIVLGASFTSCSDQYAEDLFTESNPPTSGGNDGSDPKGHKPPGLD